MKLVIKLGYSVGVICLVSAACLYFVRRSTFAAVQKAENQERQDNMLLILPEGIAEVKDGWTDNDVTFFQAVNYRNIPKAYVAIATSPKGFGGKVTVMAGLNPDGTIRGVLVLAHSETPGIGTQATDRKTKRSLWQALKGGDDDTPKLPPNRFLDSFVGQSLNEKKLKKHGPGSICVVSGATYSSEAVMDAVNKVGECWRRHQETLANKEN